MEVKPGLSKLKTQRLHCNEMSMIHWMCGVTLRDEFSSEELRARLGIKSILEVLYQRRDDNSWLQKIHNLEIVGQSGRGRPCKTWEQAISEDLVC